MGAAWIVEVWPGAGPVQADTDFFSFWWRWWAVITGVGTLGGLLGGSGDAGRFRAVGDIKVDTGSVVSFAIDVCLSGAEIATARFAPANAAFVNAVGDG